MTFANMMVTWFRVLYTLVKEKIIGDRSWKETSEKINSAVLEDPFFKVGNRSQRKNA